MNIQQYRRAKAEARSLYEARRLIALGRNPSPAVVAHAALTSPNVARAVLEREGIVWVYKPRAAYKLTSGKRG